MDPNFASPVQVDETDLQFVRLLWRTLPFKGMRWFVVFSTLDIWLTYFLLGKKSNVMNVNPIGQFLIESIGVGGIVLFKIALSIFVAWGVQLVAIKRPKSAHFLLFLDNRRHMPRLLYFWNVDTKSRVELLY